MSLSIYNLHSIIDFIEAFENQTLPISEWNHEAHLVVAIYYTNRYTFSEALERVRKGIIAYNETVGTPNSDTSGYHETLTRFWLWVANDFIKKLRSNDLALLCNTFIQSEVSDKHFPLKFYSREVLLSSEARWQWIAPNLITLTNDEP